MNSAIIVSGNSLSLFYAKPLTQPVLDYCKLEIREQISMIFQSKYRHFQTAKSIWKCPRQIGVRHVLASRCYNETKSYRHFSGTCRHYAICIKCHEFVQFLHLSACDLHVISVTWVLSKYMLVCIFQMVQGNGKIQCPLRSLVSKIHWLSKLKASLSLDYAHHVNQNGQYSTNWYD